MPAGDWLALLNFIAFVAMLSVMGFQLYRLIRLYRQIKRLGAVVDYLRKIAECIKSAETKRACA